MDKSTKRYYLTSKNDKTIKQFFDKFIAIPKDLEDIENEISVENIKTWLEENRQVPTYPNVANGKDGYIIFRHAVKMFSPETVNIIKQETGLSQRKLAEKYKCSVATINKILKDKY